VTDRHFGADICCRLYLVRGLAGDFLAGLFFRITARTEQRRGRQQGNQRQQQLDSLSLLHGTYLL
jgi:hypothetical protein